MPTLFDWPEIHSQAALWEDEAALVLNKPPGVSVTGERHDADLVTLAAASGETLFPAHRIDKVASGAVLFAKHLRHHGDLTRQFNRRTVTKRYLVITRAQAELLPPAGTIDLPLSTGRKGRIRVAAPRADITVSEAGTHWSVTSEQVFTHVRTYPSLTRFHLLHTAGDKQVLLVEPVTGRRHQIRVHLAWIGHPIAGDPLFEPEPASEGRTCLHSWKLGFDAAWLGGRRIELEAPVTDDFWSTLDSKDPTVPSDVLRSARDTYRRQNREPRLSGEALA
jgi:tRNA pseudouridine32 synthase/23S rRNA pseudouridine746 synthase/23S rRNA pseudouridine1911/1915/1917 synthase